MQEERSKLSKKTQDLDRAIQSLKEEIEAVSDYNQRADACNDKELKKILIHNANEEKEHFSMLLEWIRRQDPELSKELKNALFKKGPITGQH
ncbi:ferritin [Candidatus Woesearchaeota archaeon]|nr:ferritin [Candidatus Woesearchaeota archaeon]MCF7900865.1 ferritin [Candidatus Woesearchaeota archaeon]MCF8014019.1 ferritin [Candidatus Woesearchaeota archaeon]